MPNNVFANGMAIACKAGQGKVIAAFPDVCLSPPSPPAGPVPIPYPLFSFSSDTTSGSKKVKINKKEIMLKNKSYYKKCKGDEAATRSFGMGVVTHTIGGKVYFISWSMDVKIEGENIVRHLDMTTSNHASPLPNEALTIPGIENMTTYILEKCKQTYIKFKLHRHGNKNCGKGKQSHHLVQNACFMSERRGEPYYNTPKYNENDAPAICLKDSRKGTQHYRVSQKQKDWANRLKKRPTYRDLRAQEKKNLKEAVPMSEEEAECIMKIVDTYMESIGVTKDTVLRKPYS
ncbi:MAG: DUF4150 domain-containing protein [Calditrichaeota bacterium]|nr:MAG: DUF4150 domain-containing protein [Calditrichota bacterium]